MLPLTKIRKKTYLLRLGLHLRRLVVRGRPEYSTACLGENTGHTEEIRVVIGRHRVKPRKKAEYTEGGPRRGAPKVARRQTPRQNFKSFQNFASVSRGNGIRGLVEAHPGHTPGPPRTSLLGVSPSPGVPPRSPRSPRYGRGTSVTRKKFAQV